jgi:hypothetical protein
MLPSAAAAPPALTALLFKQMAGQACELLSIPRNTTIRIDRKPRIYRPEAPHPATSGSTVMAIWDQSALIDIPLKVTIQSFLGTRVPFRYT